METPKIDENCHYVQNDLHTCKIKLEKIHFDILCRSGVIKESLPGGRNPGEIGLKRNALTKDRNFTAFSLLQFMLTRFGVCSYPHI